MSTNLQDTIINLDNTNININEIENKEEIFKILYSEKLNESKFYKNLNITNILNEEFTSKLIKENTKNDLEEQQKNYLNLDNNYYFIRSLNINLTYTIVFITFLNRKLVSKIEDFYEIENYSLKISNLFLLNLDEYIDEKKNLFNNLVHSKEFLFIININNEDKEVFINNENIILNPFSGIFFSSKKEFNIINKKDNFLIINFSIYEGYDRFDYNKHPNQKFFLNA